MASSENSKTKTKQKALLWIVGLAFILASVLFTYLKKGGSDGVVVPQSDTKEQVTQKFSGLASHVDPDEAWRATKSNELDSLSEQNKSLKRELETLKNTINKSIKEAISEKTGEIEKKLTEKQQREMLELKRTTAEQVKSSQKQAQSPSYSVTTAQPQSQPQPQGIQITKRAFERANPVISEQPLGAYRGNELVKKKDDSAKLHSLTFGVEIIDSEQEIKNIVADVQEVAQEEVYAGQTVENYVPAGSFVRAILLGGIDAPTGGNAQDDPYPVLMQISDLASLPNAYKNDFKQCRVIGAGHGDISSERAIIRAEKMSCIDSKGRVIEARIKASIFDETGKAGVKGRLVSKQGQLIANSLMIGIGSGIGNAFSQSSAQYTQNALGLAQESFVDAGDAAIAGLGKGISTTFDRLSKYYIDLAEQIFPVIEVDAGRMVDLVFTSGFSINPGVIANEQPVQNNVAETIAKAQNGELTVGNIVSSAEQSIQPLANIIK
jgi:conjugal transfer pilus assembly protein TraB